MPTPRGRRMGPPTTEELVAVGRLRGRLGPALKGSKLDTDLNLLRWLRGLDFDTETTERKLRAHLRHRAAMGLDSLLEAEQDEDFRLNARYWPTVSLPPTDKSTDATLFIDFLGAVDTPGIIRVTGIAENTITRTFAYETMLDEVLKLEAETGRPAHAIYVIDLTDMVLTKDMLAMATGPCKCLAFYLQDNWVDLMGTILIVACPTFWLYLWTLVRPLLPERTRQKIVTLGPDWRKQITNYIPPENLPQFYGGLAPVPKPAIPRVPTSMYWKDDGCPLGADERSLSIAPGKSLFYTAEVGSEERLERLIFRFLLSTECRLELLYSPESGTSVEEVESLELVGPAYARHYGAHYHPNKIPVQRPRPGYYHLLLCNAHAWWSPLKARAAVLREPRSLTLDS